MIQAVFEKILEMSLVGCYSVVIVMLARRLLWKCERKYAYYLWFVVFLNLSIPFFWQSDFSLIPRQVAEFSVEGEGKSAINGQNVFPVENWSPENGIPQALLDTLGNGFHPVETGNDELLERYRNGAARGDASEGNSPVMRIAGIIWLVGIVVILGINFAEYLKLRKRIRKGNVVSWDPERRIREVDSIQSAFLFGMIRPIVYLPVGMMEVERSYIVAHELYHWKRRDYLIKPVALCITAMHWFNPLAWVALVLFCQDMEVSCDEKVLHHTSGQIRKQYAASLLRFAAAQNGFLVTSLNFGKPALESRIKNVLREKKRSVVITTAAVIGVVVLALGLTMRPKAEKLEDGTLDSSNQASSGEDQLENGQNGGDNQDSQDKQNMQAGENLSDEIPDEASAAEASSSSGQESGTDDYYRFWEEAVIGTPCNPGEEGWDLAQIQDIRNDFYDVLGGLEPGTENRTYLLAESESFLLYGKGDLNTMLLEMDGHYAEIHCGYAENYGKLPKIWEADYDGDGDAELAIVLNLLHGTGVSIDSFFLADRDEDGNLSVYQFLDADYLALLRSHLSFQSTESGTQPYVDGMEAGLAIFADEEGAYYDNVDIYDQVRFLVSSGSNGSASIMLSAGIGFYVDDQVIVDYNGSDICARVVYQDGGRFDLDNFGVYHSDFVGRLSACASDYYWNGFENFAGTLFQSHRQAQQSVQVVNVYFPEMISSEILACCEVLVDGDIHYLYFQLKPAYPEITRRVQSIGLWEIADVWEEGTTDYSLPESAESFLQEMCLVLPEFSGYDSLDVDFWHDFIFGAYTGIPYDDLGDKELVRVYRDDLEMWEDQVKVSLEEVQERARLILGVEMPVYEPKPEEMPARSTALYYQDGSYYIGCSDNPSLQYRLVESRHHREAFYDAIFVQFQMFTDWGEEYGYVSFLLYPADNENGFVILEKSISEEKREYY